MKSTLFEVIILIIIFIAYTIYGATQRAEELLTKYKEEEIHKIRQNLKNFVDVAYSTIDSNYKKSMDKKYLEKHYGYRLINIIDVVETILKLKAQEVEDGKLTLIEAQLEAQKAMEKIKYDNGRGYIWINDTTEPYPSMIMHPLIPSLNGQVMDNPKYNCAMGKEQNLFAAFVEVSKQSRGGFVDYLWSKTTDGLKTDVPKLSYVRRFSPWDWVIGTDFYVNDAILEGIEKSKEELRQMRYDNGIGFFWINNTEESAPKFYMYPIASSIENIVLAGGHLDKLGDVISSLIKICKEKGSGYKDYSWDKPTSRGTIKDVPKLSYVKLYKPLNWIIGTGVYIDDVDKIIAKKREFINQQVNTLITGISIASVVLIFFIVLLHSIVNFFSKPKTLLTELDNKDTLEETPIQKTPITPVEPQPQVGISVNDSLKLVQEISKIILMEQAKLLAYVINLQKQNNNDVNDVNG